MEFFTFFYVNYEKLKIIFFKIVQILKLRKFYVKLRKITKIYEKLRKIT